ncbi:acyltransferase family protein [Krasilnikovia sp. MM14-A1259]|uniref:acyltransferase family protein n=1 Tax=Krasilnikovia sp. MM14-A1259 TaxID=3373539 RepID=UPI0038146DBC
MPSAPTRLAALDGLRLIAALSVALYHYGTSWRLDGVHPPSYHLPAASHVTIYGFLGVELFFLISGFVICMSSWGRGLGRFAISRVSRLYPAYWVAIAITATVVTVLPITGGVPIPPTPLTTGGVLTNLTMLQQPFGVAAVDTVYWTLWTELRFYLLFALVVGVGLTYRRAVGFCIVWMLAAVLTPKLGSPLLDMVVMADFAPYFIAGIAMYLMHRFGPTLMLWAIVGVSWLLCLPRVAVRMADVHPGFDVPAWPGVVIMTGCFAVLLLIALRRADRIDWRWLTVAGALTYPFYLLHQRIGYALMRTAYPHVSLPAWVLIATTTATMLALAWLVHRYVERPLSPIMRRSLTTALNHLPRRTPRPEPVPAAQEPELTGAERRS